VVVTEHRYFGESKPFGNESLNKGNVNFLSTENALMDYANLIRHIQDKYDAHSSPVVTFGGSYGGMLAAWMRMKFPDLVQAAVVSGGPILYFKDSGIPEPLYYHWIGKIYQSLDQIGGKCSPLITEALDQLLLLSQHKKTWPELESHLHTLCKKKDDTGEFIFQMYNELVRELAFVTSKNYNYDSYQLGVHVPARPLEKVCKNYENITLNQNYKPMANFPENRPNGT